MLCEGFPSCAGCGKGLEGAGAGDGGKLIGGVTFGVHGHGGHCGYCGVNVDGGP